MRVAIGLGLAALVLGAFAVSGAVRAEEKANVDLKVGDKAPTFEATDDQGKTWKSDDHVGKKIVVVYFYPADFTGGCTKEACAFRDEGKKLTDKGIEVIGVSGDSAKNHELFKKHHKLDFTLLADEDGAIAKKFGVPVSKGGEVTVKDLDNLTIKQGVRAERWTIIIGKDGKVISREKVKDAGAEAKHVLDVLDKDGK
jgi:thioredoxin-dependent peroxiredoxin